MEIKIKKQKDIENIKIIFGKKEYFFWNFKNSFLFGTKEQITTTLNLSKSYYSEKDLKNYQEEILNICKNKNKEIDINFFSFSTLNKTTIFFNNNKYKLFFDKKWNNLIVMKK